MVRASGDDGGRDVLHRHDRGDAEHQEPKIVYAVEPDAILILEVFGKGSKKTPKQVKEVSRKRVREYRRLVREES
jgi:phage-related protein